MSSAHAPGEVLQIWDELLDGLEANLQGAEALLTDLAGSEVRPWVAPSATPPLPTELSGRVRDLLDRQEAVLARLEASRASVRGQLQLLEADPAKGMADSPLFIDQRT